MGTDTLFIIKYELLNTKSRSSHVFMQKSAFRSKQLRKRVRFYMGLSIPSPSSPALGVSGKNSIPSSPLLHVTII